MGTIPTIKRICTVPECSEKHFTKGFCKSHYLKSDLHREKSRQYRMRHPDRVKEAQNRFHKTEKYRANQTKFRTSIKGRMLVLRNGALKRKINVKLTELELKVILDDGTCFYCGGPIGCGTGVDRISADKSIGYVSENLVKCCGECNVLKSNLLSFQEMIEVTKLLKRLRNTENIWSTIKRRGK